MKVATPLTVGESVTIHPHGRRVWTVHKITPRRIELKREGTTPQASTRSVGSVYDLRRVDGPPITARPVKTSS